MFSLFVRLIISKYSKNLSIRNALLIHFLLKRLYIIELTNFMRGGLRFIFIFRNFANCKMRNKFNLIYN